MTYTPNFQDPRVRRTSERAVAFVERFVDADSHWLSQREIQRQFGNLSRPLGRYLKDQLLICTDPYFNMQTGQCKRYCRNPDGLKHIKQQLGIQAVAVKVTEKIQEQLDTGEFEYENKANREYHPLQNLPKRIKRPLLAARGYRHEYDIQCCAQTLLLQHARRQGFQGSTPALDRYISDRTSVRAELSQRLGVDTDTIKKILTAILNGGVVSAWHENMIFAYVNYNRLMIQELSVDPYVCEYQREVRDMWKSLRGTQSLRYKERFNAKMKSEIYRELEESVRRVIKRHLKSTKNKHFFEHDGWTCQRVVYMPQLINEVRRQTGFVIELDWTIHEYIDSY